MEGIYSPNAYCQFVWELFNDPERFRCRSTAATITTVIRPIYHMPFMLQ
ncbi:hypothetical protein HanXRQr2_Chr05g0198741 [Helianthus annuus]|uniref:Uncharacterized protein n=1 Tax=Helianthus annuus TaxID=4232 RepID=A0A9K3IWS8_HELAN|nr:hypothetical protein HanXRQr2_Chr05g0198741 [Helianthus annuus]KAJ0921456.1 hypothetical protein HanPSC8_Chr05g0191731 [Helianthus annuus]